MSNAGLLRGFRGNERLAATGGVLYVSLLLTTWFLVYRGFDGLAAALFTVQVGPWLVYAFGGAFVVGAVMAVSIVRYRLAMPSLVVLAAFAVAVYRTWELLQRSVTLLPGTPFDIYLVGWPVVLGLAVGGGLVERRVRGRKAAETAPP
jgi:cation transport ATPase